MEQLNFGIALSSILQYSTRRGIQTSPAIALLAKSFANVEGSVRYLAPELSLIDAFQDVLQDVMLELAAESMSKEKAARTALEVMLCSTLIADQTRTQLRDISNRELTIRVNQVQSSRSRVEDRTDTRAAANP